MRVVLMTGDKEAVEQAECNRWHSEEIHGRNRFPIVSKERPAHTKTTPVPADDGFRRNDEEGLLPTRADSPSDYPEELIEDA